MNGKFYLAKLIATISIALCSTNYVSFEASCAPLPQISSAEPNFSVPNPASVLTEEEALKIAEDLGNGKDMGSWKTMSGEAFMKWWRSCHVDASNVSLLNMDASNLVELNGLSYLVDDVNSCAKVVGLSNSDPFFNELSKKIIRIESSVSCNGKHYSVTSIDDSCFEGCSDLNLVVIPNSVEKIGSKSFAGSSLKYVIFERDSRIDSIRESAFENSSIEFISLPKSLKFVDRSAFANCENLLVLMIENPDLNVSADSFSNCKNLSHMFVPCNIKDKDIGYSGLKIGGSNSFDVMKCSYSRFGLATQEKVASGIVHWDHEFSDWMKIENENSKKRTCALCNLAEIAVDNCDGGTTSI